MATPPTLRTYWGLARDIIAFVGGLCIMFYETVAENADRPLLLVVAVAMMGLPGAAKVDNWVKALKPGPGDGE